MQVCAHLWPGVSVQASAGGSPEHAHLLLSARLPASPVTPRPAGQLGHLVLLRLHETGPGPRPGSGRTASLAPLPGKSLQADMAPGPPGTESHFLRILHLPCASRPSPGVSFAQVQGLTTTGGFFPGSIAASVT